MKNTLKVLFFAALMLSCAAPASAQKLLQGQSAPSGTVVYSLPITSITFAVDAVREDFIAGPYAEYAK